MYILSPFMQYCIKKIVFGNILGEVRALGNIIQDRKIHPLTPSSDYSNTDAHTRVLMPDLIYLNENICRGGAQFAHGTMHIKHAGEIYDTWHYAGFVIVKYIQKQNSQNIWESWTWDVSVYRDVLHLSDVDGVSYLTILQVSSIYIYIYMKWY